jgi:hypothetical protein
MEALQVSNTSYDLIACVEDHNVPSTHFVIKEAAMFGLVIGGLVMKKLYLYLGTP